jgi:hypothetical protein
VAENPSTLSVIRARHRAGVTDYRRKRVGENSWQRCPRKGGYRLARLAAQYGSEIRMMDLLAYLAGDCAIWAARHPGRRLFHRPRLSAGPPDMPTEGMRRLRAVGGKG